MQVSTDVEARFWAKTDRSGGPDACWTWKASRDSNGYGAFKFDGKKINSHRFALALKLGRMPGGLACHSCDNRPCCNPKHLHEGTYQSNMDECVARGRTCSGISAQRASMTKLSAIQVTEIRSLRRAGLSQRKIASMFGVEKKAVERIERGITWKHLT